MELMTQLLLILVSALLGGMIAAIVKVYASLGRKCDDLATRTTALEVKMDIYLEHAGFDVPKVNGAIRMHMEELKTKDRPSVGCIDISKLYKDRP